MLRGAKSEERPRTAGQRNPFGITENGLRSFLICRFRPGETWANRMRHLVQPGITKSAAIAGLATALLCYPRFALWTQRSHPIWYLEAATFCGSFVLWAFVFAWHTPLTQRPVFTLRIGARAWLPATAAAVVMAYILHRFLDPSLRQTTPQDYPLSLAQWAAMTLFSLALNQLFLVFAPFAWLMRLGRREVIAVALTVAFDVVVLLLKTHSAPEPIPHALLAPLVGVRFTLSLLAVSFYLRGGVLLASWCALIVQARHLFGLAAP